MQTVCYHSNSSKKHFNMNESHLFVRVLSDLRFNLHVPQINVAMESYEFNCLLLILLKQQSVFSQFGLIGLHN